MRNIQTLGLCLALLLTATSSDAVELNEGDFLFVGFFSGNPLGIVPGEPMMVGRSTKLSYHDHGMDWEISGKNGFYSSFTYQGP